MNRWPKYLALLGVGALPLLAGADAPEQTTPPSLASPGKAADLDTTLRDLAALGPEKLLRRLGDLKQRVHELKEQYKDKTDESSALDREAESIQAFLDGLHRLIDPRAADVPALPAPPVGAPWVRHDIETGLKSSEGARLGDVNGDGLIDLSVAWEGQQVSRLYLNPGPAEAYAPWPAVTVNTTPNVEDALLVDLDRDGRLDVVSSLEKGTERALVAWGPKDNADLLQPEAWQHDEFKQVAGVDMWMYAAPIHLHPGAPVSLVIGGKNYKSDASASIGLLISPQDNPRDLTRWQWRYLNNLSWVMAIEVRDLDGDGFEDILYTDKHGPLGGVHWLKNPGDDSAPGDTWKRTTLTGTETQGANFLTLADLDQDGLEDILAVVEEEKKPGEPDNLHRHILFFRRTDPKEAKFERHDIIAPPGIGGAKGIAVGDIDGDGRKDIVITCSGAYGNLIGTFWLRYENAPTDAVWRAYDIAGPLGTKYDLTYLVDLDGDGDLDVIANDEKEGTLGLGVFWYENPTINTHLHATPAQQAEK